MHYGQYEVIYRCAQKIPPYSGRYTVHDTVFDRHVSVPANSHEQALEHAKRHWRGNSTY
jgi:hypothetical protein